MAQMSQPRKGCRFDTLLAFDVLRERGAGRRPFLSQKMGAPCLQVRAASSQLPGSGIAELIGVPSERAHLEERVRNGGCPHEDDQKRHDDEECGHHPSLRVGIQLGRPKRGCHQWLRGAVRPKLLIGVRLPDEFGAVLRAGGDPSAPGDRSLGATLRRRRLFRPPVPAGDPGRRRGAEETRFFGRSFHGAARRLVRGPVLLGAGVVRA